MTEFEDDVLVLLLRKNNGSDENDEYRTASPEETRKRLLTSKASFPRHFQLKK